MLPLRPGVLAEAISIASTFLQRQSISLTSFLQCLHLLQLRFPVLILYVINWQRKAEHVYFLSMVEKGGAKAFIVTCILLRIINFLP